MVMWKCKWQNVTEKPSTLIDTLKHAKPELYPNISAAKLFIAWSKFRGISGWTCIKDKPLVYPQPS
jgi:hypothetical protein